MYITNYGKYTLFYEFPKNWEYYAQTVCTRPLLGGEGAGSEAKESETRPSLLFAILLHSFVYYTECRTKKNREATFNLYLGV